LIVETELINACKENNEQAQSILYKRYAPLLKGVCMRYERDKDAIQDLLQDIFIKVFKNIKNFNGEGSSFEGWLKRITVNHCIDNINKKKRKNESLFGENEEIENISDENEDEESNIVSQIIEAGFTKEKLIALINSIPENYATVFNLFFIDDQSHQSIAQLLNITESLSRKWLFRSKDLIKKQLLLELQTSKEVYR
jgi:RNA polymerase sigma-70 factor (ECF subfamily)